MDRLTMGMIAGGLLGIAGAGISLALSDRNSRNQIMRSTKQIARKASNMMPNMMQ